MHKSARIQPALLNKRLSAGILDTLLLFLSSIIIYFILLYTVFSIFGYVSMKNDIKDIEVEYSLNLKEGEDYKVYEKVIKDIYFNKYPDEIVKQYKELYGKNYSITHIYNIVVLRLPAEPTYNNYKTDFYQYANKEDGTFDVDSIALLIPGEGVNYERNLQSLYQSNYRRMSNLVETFNYEYFDLNSKTYSYECYARIIAYIISFVVLFVIIPLKNEETRTLCMKKFDLAYVDSNSGYYPKKYKIILRYILCFILPFIGYIISTKYSIIILILGSLLIDYLLMLFSRENLNIPDSILKLETCKLSESLLFKNKADEEEFLESEEGQKVSDESFLKALESAEEIIIPNTEE